MAALLIGYAWVSTDQQDLTVRRKTELASDNDGWLRRRTSPGYRDRHLDLPVRRSVERKVSGAAQGADEESAITDRTRHPLFGLTPNSRIAVERDV